jgi:hypothetical protein
MPPTLHIGDKTEASLSELVVPVSLNESSKDLGALRTGSGRRNDSGQGDGRHENQPSAHGESHRNAWPDFCAFCGMNGKSEGQSREPYGRWC